MTKSIRETILDALNDNDQAYITNNYNRALGDAVSALEKRESFAVSNVLSAVEARHGSEYADEGVELLDREGLNVSGWIAGVEKTQEPEFLAAGDNTEGVLPPFGDPEVEHVTIPTLKIDDTVHPAETDQSEGEEPVAGQGITDYYHLTFEGSSVEVRIAANASTAGLKKKQLRKLVKFLRSL